MARASHTVRFPARFALIAASNPCPCGYAGSHDRECRCTIAELERHGSRLSGPLADRIDLHLHVQRVPTDALASHTHADRSTVVRARVTAARERQRRRYAPLSRGGMSLVATTNAAAPMRALVPAARLDTDARALLVRAADRLTLSARAYHRVMRVSRTIADLDDSDTVTRQHVAEALCFRPAPVAHEGLMRDGALSGIGADPSQVAAAAGVGA